MKCVLGAYRGGGGSKRPKKAVRTMYTFPILTYTVLRKLHSRFCPQFERKRECAVEASSIKITRNNEEKAT